MAPTPEAKDAFAEWVTRPERRTRETYAPFEPVLQGLRELVAKQGRGGEAIPPSEKQTGSR